MRYLGVTRLLRGQVRINFSPLVNQPVVLPVQLNWEMEEGKIANGLAQ
jgi:hypothetical protein